MDQETLLQVFPQEEQPTGFVLFPGLTPDQSENTMRFLELAADTFGTPFCSLIMERHILRRNTYEQLYDPLTGKKRCLYRDGQKVIRGRSGIDWSRPTVYDVACGNTLFQNHKSAYGEARPSLLEAVLSSTDSQSYLFYPVLVEAHPRMRCITLDNGKKQWSTFNYTTGDVRAARCAWVDIDGHDIELEHLQILNPIAIENLLEILPAYCAETGIPTPAIVNSGRGIHMYWWFEQAIPLLEIHQHNTFIALLKCLNMWATNLIQLDSVCDKIWKTDHAVAAIFHQMNLPGCVHPKTGKTRYVVNKYGRDYNLCSYESLIAASKCCSDNSHEESTKTSSSHKDSEKTAVTDVKVTTQKEHNAPFNASYHTEPSPSKATSTPYECNNFGRMLPKMLQWADGRSWDLHLYCCRETFLFICGCIMYKQSTFFDTDKITHPLHKINNQFRVPLDCSEVNNIIDQLTLKAANGTDPYTSGYLYSYEKIANKLNMTAEERKIFLSSNKSAPYNEYVKLNFKLKRKEMVDTVPKISDSETDTEHKKRCFDLTKKWFQDQFKGIDRNKARTRRRAAREGYTGRPGRHKKDNTIEQHKCRELRNQGLTQRQIAEVMGCSKSKVNKLLKN